MIQRRVQPSAQLCAEDREGLTVVGNLDVKQQELDVGKYREDLTQNPAI